MSQCATYNLKTKKIKKKNLNILIVDDDEECGECLKIILENDDHNVTIADEGAKCISLCQQNIFDVVFMDYHLEGIDGAHITQILKENISNHSMILAYTGDDSKLALNNFKNVGMDGVMIKPINAEHVSKLVKYIEECNGEFNLVSKLVKKHKNTIIF